MVGKALFPTEFHDLAIAPNLLALVVLHIHVLGVVLPLFDGPWASATTWDLSCSISSSTGSTGLSE